MTIRAIYQSVRRAIARTIFGEPVYSNPACFTDDELADALGLRRVILTDSFLDIPAKPMSRSERLVDIARRRNALKDQIALAIKQKKPRLALRGQLAKLSHEELTVEAGR